MTLRTPFSRRRQGAAAPKSFWSLAGFFHSRDRWLDSLAAVGRGSSTCRRRFQLNVEELENRELLSQAFTPGDLVVERIGTGGSAALTSSATPVFLDEYTTSGSLISAATVALPTTASGSNKSLTESGSATSDGLLLNSVDGHYLTVTGYAATVGTASVASTTSASTPRVVGMVDSNGNVNTTTSINAAYSGNNIRGAITIDDQNFWTSGATSGIQYVGLGSTGPSLSVSTNFTTVRGLGIVNDQLFTDAGTIPATPNAATTLAGLGAVGTGLPNIPGQATVEQTGFPTANDASGNAPSPYEFVFDGPNTVYIADDRTDGSGGLQKWSLNAGVWSLDYNIQDGSGSGSGLRGLVGNFTGTNPVLYGTTTQTSANNIVQFTDTGIGFSVLTLATAATDEVFRGIAFAPTPGTGTTTALSSNFNPSNPGGTFALTANVNPTSGPTGTVTFFDNGVVLPGGVVTLQSGSTTAMCSVSGLAPGTNVITAVYSGDSNYDASAASGPSFTSLDNAPFVAGTANTFTASATNATSYGLSGAPSWLTISSAGVLSGTPPAVTQTASYVFQITAADGNGNPGTQGFTLYVAPGATPAQPLTPGDLLVYREGSGATTYGAQGSGGSTSGIAAGVYLDEYTTNGTFVETLFMPTTGSTTTVATLSGTTEGNMTLSADGQSVTFTGYSAAVGTAGLASTTSVAAPRVIGTVNSAGVVNTSTQLSSPSLPSYSGATFRSATTVNGAEFWTAGSAGGILYVNTAGAANQSGTEINAISNTRTVAVQDGTVYWGTGTTGTTGPGVYNESAALPTALSSDNKDVGTSALLSPYQFFTINLDGGNVLDSSSVMYVVDDGSAGGTDIGGLERYTYSGTAWNPTPTLVASNVTDIRSLTGVLVGGNVMLYGCEATDSIGTTSSFNSSIDSLIDMGGDSSGLSWTPLVSYSDGGSSASPIVQFRGITMVPKSAGTTAPNLAVQSNPAGPNVLFSQPITVTANLVPQTGWVSFMDGSDTLATVAISSGMASYTIPANTLPIGANTINVFYGGSPTYSASTKSINLTVFANSTNLQVQGTATPIHIGTNATLTATLTFTGTGTPTGTITFMDNALLLGIVSSLTEVNATTYTATLSVPTSPTQVSGDLTPGLHGIEAIYSGDLNFTGSTGTTIQSVNANPFGPGDLLVYRDGDGTNALVATTGGNAVYVDEYTTAANQTTPVQSIAFPGFDSGTTHALLADSQQSNEGQLSLSSNGAYIFLTGYDAPITTTATLDTSAATIIPRTVGAIKYDGTVLSGVALSDLSSAGSVRAVISPDGNQFYAAGSTGEVRYVGSYTPSAGSQTSTQIDTGVNGTTVSLSQLEIFNNQLYAASFTGSQLKIGIVGSSGLPTTSGQKITPLPGIPLGGSTVPDSPTAFYLTQLNPASSGPDTLYIADDGSNFNNGTITKWTLISGSWVQNDVIAADGMTLLGFDGMQGQTVDGVVTLFLTYGNGGNSNLGGALLYSVTDSGGYNMPFSNDSPTTAFSTLASLSFTGSKENFRGVSLVPVVPVAATHFGINAPTNAAAGTPFNFTVTALDANNNSTSNYTGTVHFTTSNGNATLPADATLFDGVGTFSATLKLAVNSTIAVSDTMVSAMTGTSGNIVVGPGAANHFAFHAPTSAASGTAFTFTITAQDQFYNTASTYAGTVDFVSGDNAATLPPNATLTGGSGTFSATLRTPGPQTIIAYDSVSNAVTGITAPIDVGGLATHFVISAPIATTAGNPFGFEVTALDQLNNTAIGYTGTVDFTSSDSQASFSSTTATLTSGTGFFAGSLKTAGNQTLFAADSVSGSIAGASGSIVVTGLAANHFVVTTATLPAFPGIPAAYPTLAGAATSFASTGVPLVFTVVAEDQYGNISHSYAGSVGFSSSDTAAGVVLPSASTLTGGVGAFSATLVTPGNQTITATDTVHNSGPNAIAGTSSPLATRGLVVTSFVPTPGGFTITFNKPFNASTVNLYTIASLPDDVTLVTNGSQVSIRGSLVINAGATSFTFVKTDTASPTSAFNPSSGLLAAGAYTVTLRSFNAVAGNGFQDALSGPLDGKDSGVPGANYQITFVVTAPPVAVGIPDFARGPSNTDAIFLSSTLPNGSTFALSYTNPAATPATGTATITFSTIAATLQANIQAALTSGGLAPQVGVSGGSGTPNAVVVTTNDASSGANVLVTFQAALAQTTSQLLTSTTPGVSIAAASINVSNNIAGSGIPIALSSGLNVTSGSFTLQYNPALLNITGVVSKISGATFTLNNTINSATSATAVLSLSSPTPLAASATAITLGSLLATVPLSAAADYGAKQLLHFSAEQLGGTSGLIAVTDEDGVEVTAFFGDVIDAGGPFGLQDAGNIATAAGLVPNTIAQTLPGFSAFPDLDPVIIGDVSLQGSVNSTDAGAMNQQVGGTAKPTIPYAPIGLPIVPVGPDPALSIAANLLAAPGTTLVVPVNIDTPRPEGSGGMMDAMLALTYDPRVFSVSAADVQLGTVPENGSGWQLSAQVNAQKGQIGIELFSAAPIQSTAGGSLVTIALHVVGTAPAGTTALQVVPYVDPSGGMRVYQTQVSDALGAYVLHPAGAEPGSPGTVTIAAAATGADSGGLFSQTAMLSSAATTSTYEQQQPAAPASLANSAGALPMAIVEQVFGSLAPTANGAPDSAFWQPSAILSTESGDFGSADVRNLGLTANSAGLAPGDWLAGDDLRHLNKAARWEQSGVMEGILDDGTSDNENLAGFEAFFACEAKDFRTS